MRTAGFALLGCLAGAAVGAVAAFLLVFLIYDVLGLASHGADGLSGFGTLVLLSLLLSLGGGMGGAMVGREGEGWRAGTRRRDRRGGPRHPRLLSLLRRRRDRRLTDRIDAFTDAALAFAVTLLVGIVSILMSFFRASANFAPLAYSTLPIGIGLFGWRYDWGRRRAARTGTE